MALASSDLLQQIAAHLIQNANRVVQRRGHASALFAGASFGNAGARCGEEQAVALAAALAQLAAHQV